MATPQQKWAAALLKALGIHQTPGAVRAITGWENAEGGHWHNDARFNPLNTTQPAAGAGNTGTQGNIKQYRNWQQGIQATVETLRNGRYNNILGALRSGNADAVAGAISQTPWGTSGDLVRRTIASTPTVAGVHAMGVDGGAAAGGAAPQKPTTPGDLAPTTLTQHTFDQAGYDQARRLVVLGQHLAKRNPNNPLLRLGIVGTQAPNPQDYVSEQTLTSLSGSQLASGIQSRGYSPTSANLIQTVTERANKIDAQHLPYKWGGGHGSKPVKPGSGVPVDCSGAVSSVLGISPRVSGDMGSAPGAKPGRGKVNVYYNGTHTFMEVNGHFFGTSASNPGGGAGWIPRSKISSQYLKNFKVVHFD